MPIFYDIKITPVSENLYCATLKGGIMKNVIVKLDDSSFKYWSDSAYISGKDLPDFLSDMLESLSDFRWELDSDE